MKRIIICSILAITSIDGQVCCSLVGTVNTGTSTVVSAHYPSDMEFEKEMKWNVGLIGTMNFNNSELIKYPFANNGYFEISDYFTKTSIWFIHASFSAILLNETVSFDKASTYIIGGKGQIGIRNKLTYRMGFLEYSLNFPVKPYYTNNDFPFKTDVIPSYSINWIKTKLLDSNFNLQIWIDFLDRRTNA